MKSITEKILADNEENLSRYIQKYMNRYPVLGYDTYVQSMKKEDNKFVAVMSRWDSCD
jgi:hypothetical protein